MTDKVEETIEGPDAEIVEFPVQADEEERDQVSYHAILEVWRELLKGAGPNDAAGVTPHWANRMVSEYRHLTFADTEKLHRLYYDRIARLASLLDDIIDANPNCLKVSKPDEDREQNDALYKQVLTDWQKEIVHWEMQWSPISPLAAVEIASMGEIHKAFFGQTGLTQHLENIRLDFTDADSEALAAELNEIRLSYLAPEVSGE
jgi:hypothetical protein